MIKLYPIWSEIKSFAYTHIIKAYKTKVVNPGENIVMYQIVFSDGFHFNMFKKENENFFYLYNSSIIETSELEQNIEENNLLSLFKIERKGGYYYFEIPANKVIIMPDQIDEIKAVANERIIRAKLKEKSIGTFDYLKFCTLIFPPNPINKIKNRYNVFYNLDKNYFFTISGITNELKLEQDLKKYNVKYTKDTSGKIKISKQGNPIIFEK